MIDTTKCVLISSSRPRVGWPTGGGVERPPQDSTVRAPPSFAVAHPTAYSARRNSACPHERGSVLTKPLYAPVQARKHATRRHRKPTASLPQRSNTTLPAYILPPCCESSTSWTPPLVFRRRGERQSRFCCPEMRKVTEAQTPRYEHYATFCVSLFSTLPAQDATNVPRTDDPRTSKTYSIYI